MNYTREDLVKERIKILQEMDFFIIKNLDKATVNYWTDNTDDLFCEEICYNYAVNDELWLKTVKLFDACTKEWRKRKNV